MAISINDVENQSYKDSIIHNLDSRIKLIFTLILIVYAVYTTDLRILLILEIYLTILLIFSKVSLVYAFKRVLLLLPFGGFIAVFQPFTHPGTVLYTLPLGLTITLEGVLFGLLLISRLTVCLTCIVLLSSTTPIQNIVDAGRRLGFPKTMSMLMSLTIRYVFFFFDYMESIRKAQKSRCFDIWNKKTAYRWRVRQVGHTIASIFLKSYEQGEHVYYSMLSRGYTGEPTMYEPNSVVDPWDYVYIVLVIGIIVVLQSSLFLGFF